MAKICLDAGHYGKYNRSPIVPEYYESERMWKLTELLAAALKKRGVTVVKTRTNQATDLALVSRGKKAQGCDLLLSLHSNASSTETPDFPVAIVFRDDTKTNLDERSEDIGLKLAKVCADVMGTKQEGRIMTRANSGDRDGNGYKDDEYYGVLHGAKLVKVPGVIMEHSFHTNKRAAQWLLSDSNLSKLAEAEADVLAAWLKGTAQKPTAPAVKPTASNTGKIKVDAARSLHKAYSRLWTVNVREDDDLKMRTGAGTNKDIIKSLPKGSKVRCYGYYTNNAGTIWLYVVDDEGTQGFVSKAYLK